VQTCGHTQLICSNMIWILLLLMAAEKMLPGWALHGQMHLAE
jgi:hypothetical protein